MPIRPTHRRAVAAAALLAAAGATLVAAGGAATADPDTGRTADKAALRHVRDVTAAYRDVDAALADGFTATTACTESPAGGMGLHYINWERLAAPVDPDRPPILLYRKVGAHLELMGAEWFQPDADQDLSTDGDRPSLFGHPFNGPMPGHEAGMPIHFDLHVWAWHSNPSGDFEPWNPTVSC